jgi:LmbE family N-acetylglucosaminyl deacetylase
MLCKKLSKKFASLLIFFTVFFLTGFGFDNDNKWSVVDIIYSLTVPASRKAVFLFPHQDDEMFLAGQIVKNLEEKKDVYAIMVTDGGSSVVRSILNGRNDRGYLVHNNFGPKRHVPPFEGYDPLDRKDFAAARNREFYDSMQRLGISPRHIYFANPGGVDGSHHPLYKDGSLSKKLAREVVENFYQKIGDADYYTVAGDMEFGKLAHGDHVSLREGLLNFDKIKNKHFFSENNQKGKEINLSQMQKRIKYYALRSYFLWAPHEGRFAVGMYSVKNLLDTWSTSGKEYEISFDQNIAKKD